MILSALTIALLSAPPFAAATMPQQFVMPCPVESPSIPKIPMSDEIERIPTRLIGTDVMAQDTVRKPFKLGTSISIDPEGE